jgi:hypothetical protein
MTRSVLVSKSSISGICPLELKIIPSFNWVTDLKHASNRRCPIFSLILWTVSLSCLHTAWPRNESTLKEFAGAG